MKSKFRMLLAAITFSAALATPVSDSTFTVGSSIFKANYKGGLGNDLTLTVVP